MTRLVHRAFSVLRALSDGPASLNSLHHETKLHRTTLLRILEALIEEGVVRRAIGGDTYHITHNVKNLGRNITPPDLLAEAASEHLRAYTTVVKWPTDVLHLHPKHPCLVVTDTNRPKSPFPVKPNRIGRKVPLLPSAAGRAYLAFTMKSERDRLLRKAKRPGYSGTSPSFKPEILEEELRHVRQQGYGTRSETFRGGDFLSKTVGNDGLLALAVPIFNGPHILAVLNTQWNAKAYDETGFSARYLSLQTELADAISQDFQRLEGK